MSEEAKTKTPQELMEDAQGLVISLASNVRRKIPFRVDLDDLIAYGEVGLAEAARDYDPSKGAAFTTFAYYRVRGAIYDGLSKMSWTSRARYRKWRFEQMANEKLAEEAMHSASSDLESEAKWLRDATEQLAVIFFVLPRRWKIWSSRVLARRPHRTVCVLNCGSTRNSGKAPRTSEWFAADRTETH